MADDVVRAAYTARAEEYTAALGSMDAVQDADRRLITRWAGSVHGRIVDAGCGPGHWTHFLATAGADIEGVDLVPAFVELARTRYPSAQFRVASLTDLGVTDQALDGVLAWYSLIHLEPDRVSDALAEFARCTGAGGSLVVGFVRGRRLEVFPHAVTPAYQWPVESLVDRMESAGFEVDEVHTRTDEGRRPHAAVVARRRVAT